jgi:hypothetical protein
MDKLYPIIRRKRRPLIQENAEKLKAETLKVLTVQPVVKMPEVKPAKISKPDDAESPATTAAP